MTCPQSGIENAADARLCRHCGATLPEGPQPVPLRLQHVAASRLCLLTAAVSSAAVSSVASAASSASAASASVSAVSSVVCGTYSFVLMM